MKSNSNTGAYVVVVILTIGLVFISYLLFNSLIAGIKFINPNVIAALIAGLVTVIGYFLTRNFERRKIIEQQIRENKLPVYEEFIGFLLKVIFQAKNNNPVSETEMEEFMIKFNHKSIIWLSDKTLIAYIKWKEASAIVNSSSSPNKDVITPMYLLEDLLYEFRKDIGHANNGLVKGSLLSLFITGLSDYEQHATSRR